MDRTTEFRDLAPPQGFKKRQSDAFLETATYIYKQISHMHNFLSRARKAYLGVVEYVDHPVNVDDFSLYQILRDIPFLNNQEKDHLDLQVQSVLKSTLSNIQSLNAQIKGKSHINELRTSVILILEQKLMAASQIQRDMQENRLEQNLRSQHRSKDSLRKPEVMPKALSYVDDDSDEEFFKGDQAQMLEHENAAILINYQDTSQQIRNAMESLSEISEMQTLLAQHLSTQMEIIDTIHENTMSANQNIEDGMKQLDSTKKRMGGPRYWAFWLMIGASAFLLFVDYILA